jgi:HSP20 family protein
VGLILVGASVHTGRAVGNGKQQNIPVRIYRTDGRLMVAAPMAGLEPEDIAVEVTADGRLVLYGDLRGMLKEVKELLLDEWSIGTYHRELALTTPVNAKCANVTSGNGLLLITLSISEQTLPARLTLERITPTHGERKGNAGHPPLWIHT